MFYAQKVHKFEEYLNFELKHQVLHDQDVVKAVFRQFGFLFIYLQLDYRKLPLGEISRLHHLQRLRNEVLQFWLAPFPYNVHQITPNGRIKVNKNVRGIDFNSLSYVQFRSIARLQRLMSTIFLFEKRQLTFYFQKIH